MTMELEASGVWWAFILGRRFYTLSPSQQGATRLQKTNFPNPRLQMPSSSQGIVCISF